MCIAFLKGFDPYKSESKVPPEGDTTKLFRSILIFELFSKQNLQNQLKPSNVTPFFWLIGLTLQ